MAMVIAARRALHVAEDRHPATRVLARVFAAHFVCESFAYSENIGMSSMRLSAVPSMAELHDEPITCARRTT